MAAGEKSPIGANEVVAIGLGVAALWRIRQRRRKEAQARQEAERARQAEEHQQGGSEKDS